MQKLISMILMLCLALSQAFTNILHTTNTPNNETLSNSLTQSNYPTTQSILLLTPNRDLSRTTTTTKDIQTNALNANLSIDNRIFTNNGRNDIAQDITSFKDNVIKASIGASITTLNPFITTYQILHSKSNPNKDERISFRESINQWKSNQTTMVNTNRLATSQYRNILNNLDNIDNPQSLESIHNALNPSENLHINFYYDESDNALGFFDKTSKDKSIKQIYLNTAQGTATDTHTLINTYNHEISHQYTSNETIANNAGKLGNLLYNTINVLNGDRIHKSNSINNNGRNNTLSKNGNANWLANNKFTNNFTNSNMLNSASLDTITSQTLTPQSWYASQSPYAKSILESNTYNASLVNEVDRDNLGPAIILAPLGGLSGLELGLLGTGTFLATPKGQEVLKQGQESITQALNELSNSAKNISPSDEKNASVNGITPKKGDLRKVDKDYLKDMGYDGHTLKGGGVGKSKDAKSGASKRNIYQDKDGNLYEWDGKGEPNPTGDNIKRHKK